MQGNLKGRPCINMIAKEIVKTVGILFRLKYVLPENALLNIYNALTHLV